ncbi:hypothetical protein GCM10010442_11560 [Kitasatospora kifunensis]
MAGPRITAGVTGGVLTGGVDADRASTALVRAAHGDLHADTALLRHHERGLDHQLFEGPAAELVTGSNGQLHQPGTRHQDHSPDSVIRQPGMRPQRQPRGAQHPTRLRNFHHRTDQRMVGGGLAQRDRVRGGRELEPVVLVVEGVGGQLDVGPVGAGGQDGRPVHRHAADEEFGHR